MEFPSMPIDESKVITSRQALELKDVPKRVIIVGGGATGVEFSYIFNAYGSDVTIVELADRILNKEDYKKKLLNAKVLVNPQERKDTILTLGKKLT